MKNSNLNVSDIIKRKDIESWNKGDTVTIKAPCGRGKSYFIKNDLFDYAKERGEKILFLIHRSNCLNQFRMELESENKTDTIHIRTYQKIESNIKRGIPVDISEYTYVICDEFHYFASDSFNKYTDLSFEFILELTNQVKIFMSATGKFMTRYINNYMKVKTIDYEIEDNFSFINKLEFYYSPETLDYYIEEAYKNKQKTLFFLKLEDVKKYYNKYKNVSLMNCSDSQKEYKQVDQYRIQQTLINEKFDSLFMFTTIVMDAGLNLVDDELMNIVIDVGTDIDTIIQCIGRKRLTESSSKVNVLMRAYSNQQLGGFERVINNTLEHANYLLDYGETEYRMKYNRNPDSNQIVYYDTESESFKSNKLRFYKLTSEGSKLDLFKVNKNNKYVNYISYTLDLNYELIDGKSDKMKLNDYLKYLYENEVRIVKDINDELSDKFNYESQSNLINKINLCINGKQMKTTKTINYGLNMIDSRYIVGQSKSANLRYWRILKI